MSSSQNMIFLSAESCFFGTALLLCSNRSSKRETAKASRPKHGMDLMSLQRNKCVFPISLFTMKSRSSQISFFKYASLVKKASRVAGIYARNCFFLSLAHLRKPRLIKLFLNGDPLGKPITSLLGTQLR
jgi:hypothetical protein